jgi:hypothetical protein
MFKINAYNVLLEQTKETHPNPPCEGGRTNRERWRINYDDT